MKKLVSLLLIAFSFIMLDFSSENVSSLTFDEAPTLNDYIKERGKDKLEYVIFAIARLKYGATATNWEELEEEGTKLLQNFSPSQVAEFIFVNSFEYKLTKTAYELLMESLRADFAVVDKNYFDPLGNYKPLNGNSIMIRRDIYIDVANLFEARTIMTTTRPLTGGYEYQSDKSLYINSLEMSVKSTNVIANALRFRIVTDPDRDSNRYLPFMGQIGNVYNYSVTAQGASEEYSFFNSKGSYETSLTELNSLTNLEITLKIGDMEKVIKGSGSISADFELDKVYKIDPSKHVLDNDKEDPDEPEEPEEDKWYSPITKWFGDQYDKLKGFLGGILDKTNEVLGNIWGFLNDKLLAPFTKFFSDLWSFLVDKIATPIINAIKSITDFLTDLLIPDFADLQESIDNLRKTFSSKFDSAFSFIDSFKNAFSNAKSFHDFTITYDKNTVSPFPRNTFEETFKTARTVLSGALLLLTLIRCYKRVVGEGDILE